MANRTFQQFIGTPTRKAVLISGAVSINASAAVTASTIPFASVAKTGTGEYTVTLSDAYSAIVSATCTLQAATAVDLVPQIKSIDVVTAKTVVVRLLAVAAPTDPSAACVLHVALMLRNSSIAI